MALPSLRWRLLLGLAAAATLAVLLEGAAAGLALEASGLPARVGASVLLALAGALLGALALVGPLRLALRQRAEGLRQEEDSRALLDTLLELGPVGVAFFDVELRCVRASAALSALDGLPPGAHVGRRLPEVLPGLGAELEARLRRALETDGPVLDTHPRVQLPSQPGAPRHWFGSYVPVRASGRLLGVAASWVEVTGRMRAEHALRESQQQLGALTHSSDGRLAEQLREELNTSLKRAALEWSETFDAVASPLVVLDAQGRVLRINGAARALLQGPSEPTGQPLEALATTEPFQGALRLLEEVRGEGGPRTGAVREEASGRTWEVSVSQVHSPDAHGARTLLVAQEVTGLLRLQASLRRSETLAVLGGLVAGVAHEVKNPLFSISAVVDALQATCAEQVQLTPFLDVVRNEVRRMDRLVQELFEYGRPSEGTFQEGSLQDVLAESLSACALAGERAGVGLELRPPPGPLRVHMDTRRLFHVFRNLVENAVQHSPAGARVQLSAREVQEAGARWVCCTVRDAGPGFRPEDLPRLFEPFYSRRRGGTGLGLSIVQRIVEEHRGLVRLENHPEGGAQVHVLLPLGAASPSQESPS